MAWTPARKAPMIYPQRCKYCRTEMVRAEAKGAEFKKNGPAILCPRCDAPSPPTPLGMNPGGTDAPAD